MYMTGWVDFFYIVLIAACLIPIGRAIVSGLTDKEWEEVKKKNEMEQGKQDPDKIMGS